MSTKSKATTRPARSDDSRGALENEAEDDGVREALRELDAEVDALVKAPLVLVSESATGEQLQRTLETRQRAREDFLRVKRALADPARTLARKKAASLDALAQHHARVAETLRASLDAEVAKVREDLALLPDAAGVRSVCDVYAEAEDEQRATAAPSTARGLLDEHARAACEVA